MTDPELAALLHESTLDLEHQRSKLLRYVLAVESGVVVDCIGDAVEAMTTAGMLLARARNMAIKPQTRGAGGS